MNTPLFRRFIGSEPGFEKRPAKGTTKSRTEGYSEPIVQPDRPEPVMVPEIRNGKIVAWRPF